jgi:drug/metabolite transporter (DMT)-like permease
LATPLPIEPNDEPLLRHRVALVAAGVLWSLGGVFIKLLTAHAGWHSSAMGITFYRSLFAALCLLPLVRGRTLPRLRDSLWAIGFYILLLGLYVAATQGTSAANAIFLQYTAPIYALVLGPLFFGEPFRRSDVSALGLAMVGIAVLFFGNFRGGEQLPLLMGAGSGLMFGCFLLWMRRMRYADPVAVTAVNNAGVAVLAAAALLVVRPAELELIPRALSGQPALLPVALLLAAMGCVQIALPYVLFSYGLKRVSTVEGSLLALVEPLLNPVWVLLIVGERPTLATVAGGALIILALAGRYIPFRRRFQAA